MNENIKELLDKLINNITYIPNLSRRRKNKLIADINYIITLVLLDKFNKNI